MMCTHTYEQFLHVSVGLGLGLVLVYVFRFCILCVFFWFSLDYFVLVLFAFVMLGLVPSVLCQEVVCEERLKMTYLCWMGRKTLTLSVLVCAGNKIQLHARREIGSCWANRNGKECSEPTVSPRAIVDAWYLCLYLQRAARLHTVLTTRTSSQSRQEAQRNRPRVCVYLFSVATAFLDNCDCYKQIIKCKYSTDSCIITSITTCH